MSAMQQVGREEELSDASPSVLRTMEAFRVNVATGVPQFIFLR